MLFGRIWKALGRLEARVEALERSAEKLEADTRAGRRLQEGIDNIMGYQWPPKKDGEG